MIDWMSAGWLNLYAKVPMRHLDDIAQQRIRINASPAALLFMQAVDADIVPLSFSEIVTALQTGLIDGGEQSTQLFVTGGMAKFAPHFSRTQHAFLTALIIANRGWFEGLSEADRETYRQAVPSDQWYRHYFSEQNVPLLRQAAADGLTVHDLSAADRAAWRERTKLVAADLIEETGPGGSATLRYYFKGQGRLRRTTVGSRLTANAMATVTQQLAAEIIDTQFSDVPAAPAVPGAQPAPTTRVTTVKLAALLVAIWAPT